MDKATLWLSHAGDSHCPVLVTFGIAFQPGIAPNGENETKMKVQMKTEFLFCQQNTSPGRFPAVRTSCRTFSSNQLGPPRCRSCGSRSRKESTTDINPESNSQIGFGGLHRSVPGRPWIRPCKWPGSCGDSPRRTTKNTPAQLLTTADH